MTLSMKDKILKRFLLASGEPISGQHLAEELGISRTAVWKHLQSLQEEGYAFDTIKKKGYLLLSKPDRVDAASVASMLSTKRFGQTIHYMEECATTQTISHELARNGALDGTVVIAETQTAGKGRMSRPWESTKGKGIWMTVIIKPDVLPHQAPQFTLVAAVAIVNAMKSLYSSFTPVIKWPNDILINGRKCTGILTEMIAEMDRVQALLIGIGINVNQQQEDFPESLHSIATSLSIEEGSLLNRAQLVGTILNYLEKYSDLYIAEGFSPIKILWEEASGTIGKQIKATTLTEVIQGKAIGITESGVLEIQLENGEIRSVYSADIELDE
ncbi:biotin--[acetyl-CoA-carboxylase] ligase [Ureibacillus sinduriensis]|uniref:Bifunctional ligase/repressor BirA n=1 Tax=Ureibacillus sinduriensis BLB-1 = JCM 15800 TaxID=1384057 RepID=A0A0A3HNK7_9BACL|nr:biotin--[acetyl-CoA-carboxylase] ligase [Ureibacillus sinduriensis]KGR74161.1 biotin--acetyl-CoA-carboxylase ligase [Ureibacillus sinduriensis BLB-1 = JCM 15800]